MLNQTDPTVLVGLHQEAWPDPAAHPMPSPLVAYVSATKLIGSGAFAILLAGMVSLMLQENALSQQPYEGWRLWLRIAVVIGMTALGIGVLIAGIRAIISPKVLVEAGPQGLRAPDLYRDVIPWSDLAVVVHDKPRIKIFGTGRIIIGVRNGERLGRANTTDLKPADNGGTLDAAQLPQLLNVPLERMLATIQAYRAHFGRHGASSLPD
ncbi:MAG: hypothetical protein ACM31O_12780 [Bacteroidota bacterium]